MRFVFLVVIGLATSVSNAELVIRITESGGDLTFEQSGTFDESGLTAVLGFGSTGTNFFRHTFLSGNDSWVQSITTPNFIGHQGLIFTPSANWTNPSGTLIAPTVLATTGGFGFYFDPTNMRAASSDTPGSITLDASFADLGFTANETLTITNPNNGDTILVTSVASMGVVPEPTSFTLATFGCFVLLAPRRRR